MKWRKWRRALSLLMNPPALRVQLGNELRALVAPIAWVVAGCYRRWWVPDCRIVVVIGSFGKTTTTSVAARVLNFVSSSRVGANSIPKVAVALLRLRRGTTTAVFEAGIAAKGQMQQLAWMIRPDVVVVTSVGLEHHENLGSLEDIRAEKAIMVAALRPDGLAILNGDDPNVVWMGSQTSARIVRYGADASNDYRASDVSLDFPPRMELRIGFGREEARLTTRLVGSAAAHSLLAGFALGREAGVSASSLCRSLGGIAAVERRMQPVEFTSGAWGIVDDRKAVPETIDHALQTLAELPAKRKWLVLGEIGLPDPEDPEAVDRIYREWGGRCAEVCDRLLLASADPLRRRQLADGAADAGLATECIVDFGGRLPAIVEYLRKHSREGDIVLIKGRYHERLTRIAHALTGSDVRCWVERCEPRGLECHSCPALTGRGSRRSRPEPA